MSPAPNSSAPPDLCLCARLLSLAADATRLTVSEVGQESGAELTQALQLSHALSSHTPTYPPSCPVSWHLRLAPDPQNHMVLGNPCSSSRTLDMQVSALLAEMTE